MVGQTGQTGPQKPQQNPQRPAPKPREDEDDGLFRDDQSDDGWRKKDGPGSGGGYGIRSVPGTGVLRDSSNIGYTEPEQLELFTDKVDIKFPRTRK